MQYFHGAHRRKSYFEGWYFKQSNGEETIALIPAYHVDEKGRASASLQVIGSWGAAWADFPAQAFHARENALQIQVGGSSFSKEGLSLHLETEGLTLQGSLAFSPFTEPCGPIMGPARFVPLMQCSHGVVSLCHRVDGELTVQGRPLRFENATGYLETDWGRSFPRSYLWTQCNWREEDGGDGCVMASVAHIPYLGLQVTGCVCCVYLGGREYRLATYRGARIAACTPKRVELVQGDCRFLAELRRGEAHTLKAPDQGVMGRAVSECLRATVRYRFWDKGRLRLDLESNEAGFESCGL